MQMFFFLGCMISDLMTKAMETFFSIAGRLVHNSSYSVLGAVPLPSVTYNTDIAAVDKHEDLVSPSLSTWHHYCSKMNITLGCLILLVPLLTRALSKWRFYQTSSAQTSVPNKPVAPPVAPYWLVFVGNLFELIWDSKRFITSVVGLASQSPVDVKAGLVNFTVVSNPDQIQHVFRSSKQLSNKLTVLIALHNIFGAPDDVAQLLDDDDALLPATGPADHSKPQGRLRPEEHLSGFSNCARKFLSGPHLLSISEHFFTNLRRNMDPFDIGNDWVEFPDLYAFLQHTVARSTIEALMGSKIFEINPHIVDDFWAFDRGVPRLIQCFPRWLIPSTYRARGRIFDTARKLDALASQHLPRFKSEDPEWEPFLGSKFLRARHEYGHHVKSLPRDTLACEKMAIMFGANSNVVPSVFWYIFEALRDQDLRRRMLAEISSCMPPADGDAGTGIDVDRMITNLLDQPLLQSAYAETLRLRVALAVPRYSKDNRFAIGGRRIKQNNPIVVFTWPTVQDDDAAWIRAGRPQPQKPLDEFWAERFLVPKAPPSQDIGSMDASAGASGSAEAPPGPDVEVSLRGLGGRWMPYGGGSHLCPGRHLAKRQIIGTFAFLFSHYDVELTDSAAGDKVKPDMSWFASGTLPPLGKIPFQIKQKKGSAH